MNHREPDGEEDETYEGPPAQQSGAADEEEEESCGLHIHSVDDGSVDDPTANEFVLPRNSSPEKFFVKLKRRLSNLGVRYEKLSKKTQDGAAPPCFELAGADYDAWLTAASLTSDVPHRYDMPGEPNYCRDCTVQFRHKAIQAGACRFSNVFFEIASNNGEKEVVGVSRSPSVVPKGYRVYREMIVDEEAIENPELEWRRGPLGHGSEQDRRARAKASNARYNAARKTKPA